MDTATTNNDHLFLYTVKVEVCLKDYLKNPHNSDCVSLQELLTDKRNSFLANL